MGLNVVSRHSSARVAVSTASVVPGLSPSIVLVGRKTGTSSSSAPASSMSTRRSRVIASLVSLLLFCGVLPVVRLMFFLVHKACMATSLHFLARMLSSLTA